MGFQEFSSMRERLPSIGAQVRLVGIEVSVANFLDEEFIVGRAFFHDGRRSRSIHANTGSGTGGAAGTACGDSVSRRVGRRNLSGSLCGHGADFRCDGKLGRVGGIPTESCGLALIDSLRTRLQRDRRLGRRRRGRGSRSGGNRWFLAATKSKYSSGEYGEQASAVERA